MNTVKILGLILTLTGGVFMDTTARAIEPAKDLSRGADNFYKSDKVTQKKVSFNNIYKMKMVGNLFAPKDLKKDSKYSAIIVTGPMGAVKEQGANLYAQKLAEQGYVTLSVDLAFWGESEGLPKNSISPDMYTETFNAAVDFLGTQSIVDKNKIGVIGICGSGSFAISAAKIDPRLKAIATISMYDMGSVTRNGLKHSQTLEQRKEFIAAAANQRDIEFQGGKVKWNNYLPEKLSADVDDIRREFYDFYRTSRGAAIPKGQTLASTQNRTLVNEAKFINFYPFNDIDTISPRAMLFISGENSHSREFSEDAYKRAAEPKQLVLIPNVGHVDLYDRVDVIPFDKLATFFKDNLK